MKIGDYFKFITIIVALLPLALYDFFKNHPQLKILVGTIGFHFTLIAIGIISIVFSIVMSIKTKNAKAKNVAVDDTVGIDSIQFSFIDYFDFYLLGGLALVLIGFLSFINDKFIDNHLLIIFIFMIIYILKLNYDEIRYKANIETFNRKVRRLKAKIKTREKRMMRFEANLENRDSTINRLEADIRRHETDLANRDSRITQLETYNNNKDNRITQLESEKTIIENENKEKRDLISKYLEECKKCPQRDTFDKLIKNLK